MNKQIFQFWRKFVCGLMAFIFAISSIGPVYAQTALNMPVPGQIVGLSPEFTPAYLKGMVMNPVDPFKFNFIVYRGDEKLSEDQKSEEYRKLIKYFLAALAIPDTDQWVNLSPYEKDRIIPDNFGLTEMGRDLLAQDYLLKQISASLLNPDSDPGKKFWDTVYSKVYEKFGTTDIPTDTFNKVWIIPDKAVVYEKGNAVYVLENHLKVMMESDYLAAEKGEMVKGKGKRSRIVSAGESEAVDHSPFPSDETQELSNQILREVVIPILEKEVNEGKNFAPVRQVFSGMLLATWYKRALKESILGKIYADKSKVKGVDQKDPKTNQDIYERYVEAYKNGVFNMIKEDVDRFSQEVIPRKYFSGGLDNDYAQEGVVQKANEMDAAQDFAAKEVNLDMAEAVVKNTAGMADFAMDGSGEDRDGSYRMPKYYDKYLDEFGILGTDIFLDLGSWMARYKGDEATFRAAARKHVEQVVRSAGLRQTNRIAFTKSEEVGFIVDDFMKALKIKSDGLGGFILGIEPDSPDATWGKVPTKLAERLKDSGNPDSAMTAEPGVSVAEIEADYNEVYAAHYPVEKYGSGLQSILTRSSFAHPMAVMGLFLKRMKSVLGVTDLPVVNLIGYLDKNRTQFADPLVKDDFEKYLSRKIKSFDMQAPFVALNILSPEWWSKDRVPQWVHTVVILSTENDGQAIKDFFLNKGNSLSERIWGNDLRVFQRDITYVSTNQLKGVEIANGWKIVSNYVGLNSKYRGGRLVQEAYFPSFFHFLMQNYPGEQLKAEVASAALAEYFQSDFVKGLGFEFEALFERNSKEWKRNLVQWGHPISVYSSIPSGDFAMKGQDERSVSFEKVMEALITGVVAGQVRIMNQEARLKVDIKPKDTLESRALDLGRDMLLARIEEALLSRSEKGGDTLADIMAGGVISLFDGEALGSGEVRFKLAKSDAADFFSKLFLELARGYFNGKSAFRFQTNFRDDVAVQKAIRILKEKIAAWIRGSANVHAGEIAAIFEPRLKVELPDDLSGKEVYFNVSLDSAMLGNSMVELFRMNLETFIKNQVQEAGKIEIPVGSEDRVPSGESLSREVIRKKALAFGKLVLQNMTEKVLSRKDGPEGNNWADSIAEKVVGYFKINVISPRKIEFEKPDLDSGVARSPEETFLIGLATDYMNEAESSYEVKGKKEIAADAAKQFVTRSVAEWVRGPHKRIVAGSLVNMFESRLKVELPDDLSGDAVNFNITLLNADAAMAGLKGGIDFNTANFDMQIKRDGNGVPLPISQQNLDNIRIDGLVPVILNIVPATGSLLFSEAQTSAPLAT